MNQQSNTAAASARVNAPTGGYPAHLSRKKKKESMLAIVRIAMLALAFAIVLVGLLLLILPMFRVNRIEVVGNSYYTEEQIIEASGITVGQETLECLEMGSEICDRIETACPYATVEILHAPFFVRISVTEQQGMMYTEHEGVFYSLDRSMRVYEMRESASGFEGFLRVTLPEIYEISVGKQIVFASDDTAYIDQALAFVEENELGESLTSLDLSRKYGVSYLLQEKCRVELGNVTQIDTKHSMALEILKEKNDPETYAVINVSNPQKPTYRAVGMSEVLLDV